MGNESGNGKAHIATSREQHPNACLFFRGAARTQGSDRKDLKNFTAYAPADGREIDEACGLIEKKPVREIFSTLRYPGIPAAEGSLQQAAELSLPETVKISPPGNSLKMLIPGRKKEFHRTRRIMDELSAPSARHE